MTERWLPIETYEGLYEVSSKGRVRNTRTLRVLKHSTASNGMHHVGLYKDKKKSTFYVPHLVAEAFFGPRPKGALVCHGERGCRYHGVDNLMYRWRLS